MSVGPSTIGRDNRVRCGGDRAVRIARLAAIFSGLLVSGLFFAGCELPHQASPVSLPEGATLAFDAGMRLQASGDDARALAAYRAAIGQAPEFVDAHRAYQNLLITQHRRGDLLEEYTELLREAPGSAPRQYLRGRLLSDRHRQLDAFDDAIWADPELFFAHIGIGYVSLDEGDIERSKWAFRRAREIAPDRIEPRHGLLAVLRARVDSDPATAQEVRDLIDAILASDPNDELARRAVIQLRIEEGRTQEACEEAVRYAAEARTDAAAELARAVLGRFGTLNILETARDRLLAPGVLEDTAAAARLKILVEERSGDPAAALHVVLRVAPDVAREAETARTRWRLLLRAGRFDRYLEEQYEQRHGSGLAESDDGAAAGRMRGLQERLRAPAEESPTVIMEELLALGFHEAAIAFGRQSLDHDPTATQVGDLLDGALRHRRFLAELRDYFQRQYVSQDPLGQDEVIEDLRKISRACLGENVIDPVVTKDFLPIGSFFDPDPAGGGGLARYFDRFGCFALVGKRIGAPAEAYIMRRISSSMIDVDGNPVYRVLGEDLLVPSRAEFLGAEIAGFAFQSFIALNADRVRYGAERARRLHRDFSEELLTDALCPAADAEARVDLREPLSVAVRAEYRAYQRFLDRGGDPAQYAGLLLDAVEAHERAHILDAVRFLPIHHDLGEKLRLLWEHRFRTQEVEAWLEERAQAVALVDAESPMAVLASTLLVLPNRDAAPPHSVGYFDLMGRIVDEVERHLARYPEIDPAYTIVPQLDRLSDPRLRELGQRVLATYDS